MPDTILDALRLDGRVALVTGAARGLGQAIAYGLAEAGADIAILDRKPADETGRGVGHRMRRSHLLTVDLQDMSPERAAAVIRGCVEALGRLDILVNNAGVIHRSPALDLSQRDWQSVLDINLNSAFYLAQAAARHYRAVGQPGKIINIASMLSFQGGILTASYTAAKSAVAGMTRALANEWAASGINVNAVAPGYMSTQLTAEIRRDEVRSRAMLARIPANRWGEPADIQGAVVFLSSDAAAYVHGAILNVDGGWLAR